MSRTSAQTATAVRDALKGKDREALAALFAEDIRFSPPTDPTVFVGREIVSRMLREVFEIWDDFRYTDQLDGEGGVHVLVFATRFGEYEADGIDLLRVNEDGLVEEFQVMIRPLPSLTELNTLISARMDVLFPQGAQ